MKRWQWALVAVFALFVLAEAWVYAQPAPNNCGLNMLCRVQTLIVAGDATFTDAGFVNTQGVKFTSLQISGEDGFEAINSGVHWQIGPGVNESIFGTGGSGPRTLGSWTAGGETSSGPEGYRVTTNNPWRGNGYMLDGGTAFFMLAGMIQVDAGTHTAWQCLGGAGAETMAALECDGRIRSRTNFVLAAFYPNAVNGNSTYGGAFTVQPSRVTNINYYVSNAAGAGTTNVATLTDGTVTCTATFSCASDLNTIGVKTKTPLLADAGPCIFPGGANITVSNTGGCTPNPTVKNVRVTGWVQ